MALDSGEIGNAEAKFKPMHDPRVSDHDLVAAARNGDEDAFAELGPDDLAIGVGPRPHTHLIAWRLAGPASVGRFFGRLAS